MMPMRIKRVLRTIAIGSTLPLIGALGCLPSADELRDLAVINTQQFVTDVVTIAIDNAIADLAE